ncbi:MAG: hypothetical protein IKO84_00730 [Butyrivibrio sp.]|nr:hypothetical protein [Butyrivibrio sp.]
MKREKKTNKSVVIALGALLFIAPITVAMTTPAEAHANGVTIPTPIPDITDGERGNVEEGQSLDTNAGTVGNNDGSINTNNGTVEENNGYILTNNDHVENNNENSTIENNRGTVRNNSGLINDNYNVVENNNQGGIVKFTSSGSGTIINNDGGEVLDASSFASNSSDIIINNFYSGTITTNSDSYIRIINNYSDNEFDPSKIKDTNKFHSLTINDANNANITYSRPEFIHNDHDDKEYVQVKKNGEAKPISGTITISAKDGYKITDDGVRMNEVGQLAYNLTRNTDGSYTVTLMNLNGNVTVTPANLHLIISAIENQNNTPGITGGSTTPITITKANIAEAPANNSSSNNASASSNSDQGIATPNFTQDAINSIQAQAQTQASLAEQTGTPLQILDIYFDKKIDLNPMLIRYLCEQVSLPKRCHFNYNDQHYVLFIPAFDISAPAYQDGLDMLDKEPAKTAGFLRIEQLFKPLGFATNIIEDEETVAVLQ